MGNSAELPIPKYRCVCADEALGKLALSPAASKLTPLSFYAQELHASLMNSPPNLRELFGPSDGPTRALLGVEEKYERYASCSPEAIQRSSITAWTTTAPAHTTPPPWSNNKHRLEELSGMGRWATTGRPPRSGSWMASTGIIKAWKGLTNATIEGAGHMVPHDKPVQALELFNSCLEKCAP
ncbi:hypothetical protein CALVIDRAFT_563673 [Calocera viscosa TUFC12733]|uniref:Uncharacterized protein n=1 Tax=Calocera viscosa (strain TUFC12733) TaxID=1330018 RepID=A0A167MD61_CALVF|nr:hypothetical protein CALVIDRAFT_563673 [Calocera viscosa TUFC12733]